MKQSFLFVNLGLPSGTCWADRNILANNQFDCGAFLSYRSLFNPEAAGSDHFLILGSRTPDVIFQTEMKFVPLSELFGLIGSLALCIPTEEQMNELVSGCTWKSCDTPKGWGFEATSRYNGNSIFFPACGWYSDETMQDLSKIQRSYEAGFFSDDERFNHLISEEAWANAGDPFRCRYLTRSTDSRFVPLGWSGGTRALRVIGNQQQAYATIATFSRDLWMPIRPALSL